MSMVYVVGMGPGGSRDMTLACRAALERADILVGYTKYIALVSPLFPGKETFTTPMKRETDRCRAALEMAQQGRTVAVVCSGDAGVYGMAGLVLELTPDYPGVTVEVVPGVTAALAGAAVLGAPLTHDFAVISLSDLLTPWAVIEKRLACAAAGASPCITPPASSGRTTCGGPATSCWPTSRRRPSAAPCGTLAGRGRRRPS